MVPIMEDEEDEEEEVNSVVIEGFGRSGGPVDLSQDPAEGPRRPKLKFNLTPKFESQSRGFNNSWFKQYPQLEYSLSVDDAFCYA